MAVWGRARYLSVTEAPRNTDSAPANTRRWPTAGLMLALRLRRWADIISVLGYHIVFGATLNVGQRHRRRANIEIHSLYAIYCPQETFNNINYKSHWHYIY